MLPCEYNLNPLLVNVDPLKVEGPKILEVYSAKEFFLANFYQPFLLFTFIYFTLAYFSHKTYCKKVKIKTSKYSKIYILGVNLVLGRILELHQKILLDCYHIGKETNK